MKDFKCPVDDCENCDFHMNVSWCSKAIPEHHKIDDLYKAEMKGYFDGIKAAEEQYKLLLDILEEEPEKKVEKAKWKVVEITMPSGRIRWFAQCTNCKSSYMMMEDIYKSELVQPFALGSDKFAKYCPNCGTRMEGEME